MKYSKQNPPLVCMQTQSTCYKGTRTMTVKGVLWHSTGANNPNLKRYVQPSDNAKDRDQMLKLLGVNTNHNDWNHIERQAGLNAWVGKLADGTVTTVQTMPWNYRPWGCGSGKKGSCNTGWIQFEICEDAMTDPAYFRQAYEEAVQLTAYLCTLYNLDPMGTVTYQGVKVPVILCHQDSYQLGLGSNHGDVYIWFNKHGKDMDDVRRDVKAAMAAKEEPDLTKAETEKLIQELVPGLIKAALEKDGPAIARSVIAQQAQEAATSPVPAWAEKELQSAIASGIMDGTRPNSPVTRLEAAIMAERARQKAILIAEEMTRQED